MKKVVGIGAFYKDDTPGGMSITFSEAGHGKDLFATLNEIINNMVKGSEGEVSCGSISKEELANEYFSQLEQITPQLLMKFYGTTVKPRKIPKSVKLDFGDEMLVQYMLIFVSDIVWLTQEGFIKNDNFNGVLVQYE